MDAVAHKETTAQIRALTRQTEASEANLFTHAQTPGPENRPIPDAVKRQALDAVSHRETAAHIRLVRDTGDVTAPNTPSRGTDQVAGKVARLHHEGHGLDTTHKRVTQDGFGREL